MADQAAQYDVIGVRGIIGYFFQQLEQYSGLAWINDTCNNFESNQDTETYAGLGNVPQLREWIGRKQAKAFNEMSVKITNRDWESTLRIKNKDRRRDKTGQLMARIGDLAERAVSHDAALLSALLNTTSTTVTLPGSTTATVSCYDGLSFFNTAHKINTQTVNNSITYSLAAAPVGTAIGTGTTTAPSVAVMALAILQGIQQIYGFLDNEGQPLNELARSFVVMVPVALGGAANAAVNTQYPGIGYQNPLQFMQSPSGQGLNIRVVVNPRLTYTDSIIVLRVDSAWKPLIKQYEVLTPNSSVETQAGNEMSATAGMGLVMKALAEGSDHEFFNNEVLFSVEKAGMVGYGRFDEACLVQFVA